MFKRMFFMLVIVGLIGWAIYAFKNFQNTMITQYMAQMSKAPQTVATMTAVYDVWHTDIEAVGTFRAVSGVDISAEVAGIVEDIYFESGDFVTAGTLLVRLRAEDEIALLGSLKADAHLANLTYERDLQQLKKNAVAQSVADLSSANLEKSLALIKQQEAIIAKKFIRAPFTGRLGLRAVDLGEYLSPGNVIVTLQELDPIYFDFFVPQQDLVNIKLNDVVKVTTNLNPDKPYPGKIWALNSKVDQSSRNIEIRALIDNQKKELLPGMYGVIDIDINKNNKFITLPQTAITYNPYGNTVFVVKEKSKDKNGKPQYIAEQKFVTISRTRGDQVAISSGVEAGEQVIVAGQIKLQKGSPIVINNSVLPTNDPNPKPSEQ